MKIYDVAKKMSYFILLLVTIDSFFQFPSFLYPNYIYYDQYNIHFRPPSSISIRFPNSSYIPSSKKPAFIQRFCLFCSSCIYYYKTALKKVCKHNLSLLTFIKFTMISLINT